MRGAGSQGAHGHHAFVAQGLFARRRQFGIALANLAGHADDQPPDHGGRNDENQPHAYQVQAGGARRVGHRQRDEIQHQQGIGDDGHGADGGDAACRQGQRGDRDRGQGARKPWIGRAATEEDDGRQGADVEQDLGTVRRCWPPGYA